MRLRQLDIVDVAPCDLSGTPSDGTWPCGDCGRSEPVQRSWVVTYAMSPTGDHHRTLVCETCADELRRAAPRRGRPRRGADGSH